MDSKDYHDDDSLVAVASRLKNSDKKHADGHHRRTANERGSPTNDLDGEKRDDSGDVGDDLEDERGQERPADTG
jgi:hypothetical protein